VTCAPQQIPLCRYYRRRALRILPPYYGVLAMIHGALMPAGQLPGLPAEARRATPCAAFINPLLSSAALHCVLRASTLAFCKCLFIWHWTGTPLKYASKP
jgi:peptidoglycan/LPS O-acetylase OafA/YrhL